MFSTLRFTTPPEPQTVNIFILNHRHLELIVYHTHVCILNVRSENVRSNENRITLSHVLHSPKYLATRLASYYTFSKVFLVMMSSYKVSCENVSLVKKATFQRLRILNICQKLGHKSHVVCLVAEYLIMKVIRILGICP